MKVFFDTEFIEDGTNIHLLSVGMVREDGAELYAEVRGAPLHLADPWVRENVISKMGKVLALPRERIAEEVLSFCGIDSGHGDDERPAFWAYYGSYDWVALCQLYGRMVDGPRGWPYNCFDLKQSLVQIGDPKTEKIPVDKGDEHHALHDARWNAGVYRWLEGLGALRQPVNWHGNVLLSKSMDYNPVKVPNE